MRVTVTFLRHDCFALRLGERIRLFSPGLCFCNNLEPTL